MELPNTCFQIRVKFADGTETSILGLGTLVVNGYILRGMIMPFDLSLISAKELAVEWNLVTCLYNSGGIIFKDQTVFAELRVVGNLYEVIEDKKIYLAVRHIRTQKDVVEVHWSHKSAGASKILQRLSGEDSLQLLHGG